MGEWILSSSVLICVVILLRRLFRGKLRLTVQYAVWALVLARLLIPFSFGGTAFSVANWRTAAMEQPAVQNAMALGQIKVPAQSYEQAYKEVVGEFAAEGIDVEALPDSDLEQEVYQRMEGPSLSQILSGAARILWAAGGVAVGGLFLYTNCRFGARLRRTRRDTGLRKEGLPIYTAAGLDAPCLFGLPTPAIYVTPEAAAEPALLRHTLEHEASHFRHKDHIWALLRGLCLAVHWYNPLVWWAAFLSQRDAELACDEATIRRLGESERAEYGRTLIGMTCGKKRNVLMTATTMTSSGRGLRERILLIAKKPKMAAYTLAILLLIAAVAVGCTFTGARQESQQPETTDPTDPPQTTAPAVPPETTLPPETSIPEPDESVLTEGGDNGRIRASYIHIPMDTAEARQPYEAGVFWVPEDPQEMNRGNRYRGYVLENGQLTQLEQKDFYKEYTVHGQTVALELSYVLHEGKVLISYEPVEKGYPRATVWDSSRGVHECLVWFEFGADREYTSYYAVVDLETGELTDILAAFDPALLEERVYALERWDGNTMLFADGVLNTWLSLDIGKGTAVKYELSNHLPRVDLSECYPVGDCLVAGAFTDAIKARSDIWLFSLADWSVTQLLSGEVVRAFQPELPYLVYQDGDKNLWVLDLATLEKTALPEAKTVMSCTLGFVLYKTDDGSVCVFDRKDRESVRLLQEAGDWGMDLRESPDGRNVLLCKLDENAVRQFLIFDADTDTLIELRRENLNGVPDSFCLVWGENGQIVVGAENRRDFCIYTLADGE